MLSHQDQETSVCAFNRPLRYALSRAVRWHPCNYDVYLMAPSTSTERSIGIPQDDCRTSILSREPPLLAVPGGAATRSIASAAVPPLRERLEARHQSHGTEVTLSLAQFEKPRQFGLLAIKAEFSRFSSKKHFPANIQYLSHTLRVFRPRSAIHGPCLELVRFLRYS